MSITVPMVMDAATKVVAGVEHTTMSVDECRYTVPNPMGGMDCVCLVSHVLRVCGVPIEALCALDEPSPIAIDSNSARVILLRHGIVLTMRARLILSYAQTQQDLGAAWGNVLYEMKKLARGFTE